MLDLIRIEQEMLDCSPARALELVPHVDKAIDTLDEITQLRITHRKIHQLSA